IDPDLTAQARANAEHLIASELPAEHQTTEHPSMPSLQEPRFTLLLQQELDRIAAGQGLTGGIDVTRYEAPEPPAPSISGEAPDLDSWRQTLRKAYTASHHLTTRHENLELLEESGKNAWLIGNSQLEELLRGTEKELAETRDDVEEVNRQRKVAQENGRAEL
ncbi:BCAS2 domain-containing protein, partial [Aspergillus sp. HF37]